MVYVKQKASTKKSSLNEKIKPQSVEHQKSSLSQKGSLLLISQSL